MHLYTTSLLIISWLCAVTARAAHEGVCLLPRSLEDLTGSPPPPTTGWFIDHLSLNVASLEKSLHFYVDILGMAVYSSFNPAESLRIANVGYATDGIPFRLELVHLVGNGTTPPTPPPISSSVRSCTFSHFGLTVPNIREARQHFINNKVRILKDMGRDLDPFSPMFTAFGFDRLPEECHKYIQLRKTVIESLRGVGFEKLLVIEDPDRNIIEIITPPAPAPGSSGGEDEDRSSRLELLKN